MKKWFLIFFVGFLLISFLGLGAYFSMKGGDDEKDAKTETVERSTLAKKTVATGSIVPAKEVAIKPRVSGVIEEIYLKAGDPVKVGQEIAKIKLVPNAVSINNAEAQVQQAKLSVQAAERELRRQEQVAGTGQDLESSRIALREAEKELTRQESLFNDGIISQQAFDQFKADVDVKKAGLQNAGTTADRNLDRFRNDLDLSKSQLGSAQNNLRLLREGSSKKSGGASNVIVSTVNGTVLEVPVKEGASVIESNTFNDGSTIAVVADMRDMIFSGKVDESEAGKIKKGMPLKLTIGALPDEEYQAVLYYVSPKGKMDEGTIKFDIEASLKLKDDDFIRAGYSANADIVLEEKDDVLVIPEACLKLSGDSTFVELKQGDEFEKIEIQTGISDGLKIEVIGGLSEGDEVKVM